jgi:hypothetical protein
MLRKAVIALLAVTAVGLTAPTMALARGFGGHGSGFGGFHGGGFHGGFRGRGFGFGFAPYGYYGGYGYPYGYPYADGGYDEDDGGCYLVRRRVHTPRGWRLRRVEICG